MTEKSKQAILEEHASERNECQKWTRVMGYYRPMSSYNTGKKQESKERVYFETKPCCSL